MRPTLGSGCCRHMYGFVCVEIRKQHAPRCMGSRICSHTVQEKKKHHGPTSPSNTSQDIDAPFSSSTTFITAARRMLMLMRKNIVNHSCLPALSRSRLHGNSASDISYRIVRQVLMRPAVGSVECTRMYNAPSCYMQAVLA